MSIFEEEWEDYELDKYEFEVWLDSINKSGDPDRDEEYYNKEMDRQAEEMKQAEYPEWVISTPNYTMTISNN
jgi:hypothetical protein